MAQSNDVDIANNVVDVCAAPAIVLGSQAYDGCSDVRITANNFYYTQVAVQVYSGKAFNITGNTFSNNYDGTGWMAVSLKSNTGTITPGKISGVNIIGNTFWKQYNCLEMDGSATNVSFTGNTCLECLNSPIRTVNGAAYAYLTVSNNRFKVETTFPHAVAPFDITGGVLTDSVITDNIVDANGVNAIVAILPDGTTTSCLGANMVYRDNLILNNTSTPGRLPKFVPMSARGLTLDNKWTGATVPTNEDIFSFNTFASGDYVSFDLYYDIVIDQSGVNASVRKGYVKVCIAKIGTAAVTADITPVSSIASDISGSGGGVLPTVSWAFNNNEPASLRLTATSTLTPDSVTVNARITNFHATGVALVKST
jgi:hypothetical protein